MHERLIEAIFFTQGSDETATSLERQPINEGHHILTFTHIIMSIIMASSGRKAERQGGVRHRERPMERQRLGGVCLLLERN